ncbi:MAG TPA: aminoacyl-tRNA hydrolase [Treponemataceae bacterium]|nr:aminoacyl-tRNA hydrolase [Treponemataceae bacterium]
MSSIQLVAFLGNYGKKYQNTRHNIGWLFSQSVGIVASAPTQLKFKALYAKINDIHYIWPQTYMNLSGQSISECARFYKIKPKNILIVHDELELDLGYVSLKWSGGLGGHNGLRSIKECVLTADFWRLRLGIGRPQGIKAHDQDIAGYVLSSFTHDQAIMLSQIFMRAESFFLSLIEQADPQTLLPKWKKVCLVD